MSTSGVTTWFWADYNQYGVNHYQTLLTTKWAGILTNLLAVLITSVGGPLFNLLIGPVNFLWIKASSRWRNDPPDAIDETNDYGEAWGILLDNLRHVSGGYVNLPLGGPTALNARRRDMAKGALGTVAFILLLMAIPTALLIASITSAGLSRASIALSDSWTCGRYSYRPNSLKSTILSLEFEHKAEAEAGSYAQNCYGTSSESDHCTKFYKQSIAYSTENRAQCPFAEQMCYGGKNDAVKFTTARVSGSVLGINARNSFLFSRTMTCSAITSDDRYSRVGNSLRGFEQWEYWYGRSLADYTWANPVQESAWEIKGYSTGIHCSQPDSPKSNFVPISELSVGLLPVTLMFISSHSIMYPHLRTDPVFPATTKAAFSPEYRLPTRYFNNSTKAGVLGCVDQYEICKTAFGPCWTNENITSIPQAPENRNATEEENVIMLLLLALDLSTACGSTQFRGAEALNAQSKIAHMQSLELPEEQWKIEAEQMMQTSLARMQGNVYDIVRGSAASFDGYQDTLPVRYRGLCNLVKIQATGWTNINTFGYFGTCTAVGLLWVIGGKKRDSRGVKTLIVELAWRYYLRYSFSWMHRRLWGVYLKWLFEWMGTHVQRCILQPLMTALLHYL